MKIKGLREADDLGDRFKAARDRQGRSLQSVADAAGISKQYLSNIENGIAGEVPVELIERVAIALELKFHYSFYLILL